MEIKKVIPSGYCKGVIRAINLVKQTRLDNPQTKIYILGMIVHNTYITKALDELNIITLDDKVKSKEEWIDSIDDGIVIFTAHGIADHIKTKALNNGLRCVDASCSDVIKTKDITKEYLKQGYEVLYVGKANHPEALAVLAESTHIHLITKIDDINTLGNYQKVFVTNQTTMSIFEVKKLFDEILIKYPEAIIQREICNATSSRQQAILDLKDCDLLYIVGDTKSNNSNKLKEIAEENGINKVRLIGSALEISEDDLINVEKVYITAGASTPTYLTNQVIDVLKTYNDTKELKKPMIDLAKII